jgi:hypothetical protein
MIDPVENPMTNHPYPSMVNDPGEVLDEPQSVLEVHVSVLGVYCSLSAMRLNAPSNPPATYPFDPMTNWPISDLVGVGPSVFVDHELPDGSYSYIVLVVAAELSNP